MTDNYITCADEIGTINISEEVISTIVRHSISEVEGVSGFSNTAGAEIADRIGLKTVARGLKIRFEDSIIFIDAIITVNYGANIYSVAKSVQESVYSSVQSITGFEKCNVNIHVAGISFEK